jgi:excisionase family DNA binding protein
MMDKETSAFEQRIGITSKEAAKILGLSARQIRKLVKSGTLPAKKHGQDWEK